MQLKSGWPIGIEYQHMQDAKFETHLISISDDASLRDGFTYMEGFNERWDYSGTMSTAQLGRTVSFLSELCYAERCSFAIEQTGSFSSVTGTSMPGVIAFVDMCFLYIPQGAGGAAETVRCRSGYNGRDYHAHPGTFGMQVTVSGTMTFEPLWTWRR